MWLVERRSADTDGSIITRWREDFQNFQKALIFVVSKLDEESAEIVDDRLESLKILIEEASEGESNWDGNFPVESTVRAGCGFEDSLCILETLNDAESIVIFEVDGETRNVVFSIKGGIDLDLETGFHISWKP